MTASALFLQQLLLLPLLLQMPQTVALQRLVISRADAATSVLFGRTLVPLQLSARVQTDPSTNLRAVAPVTLDSFVVGDQWILNNWRSPLAQVLGTQSRPEAFVVDVQLSAPTDVNVSTLWLQADDAVPDEEVELTVVCGRDALRGLTGLLQIHVDGMKATFGNGWLPERTHLTQLVIDAAAVEELVVATSVTIEQMVIRHSNLSSFPTSVLGLETAVTTLVLEHNRIAGPIELTENEYAHLLDISDFRAADNRVDMARSGSKPCAKEEMIGDLAICIVKDVQRFATSVGVGIVGSSTVRSSRRLGARSASTVVTRDEAPTTIVVLTSACTAVVVVVAIVVMSFFRRFKKKASKLVDKRRSSSSRDDSSLAGSGGERLSGPMEASEAKVIADMDLGKGQVQLYKKLGAQGLWLGEYKDTQVVALKFVPRELDMSTKETNAVRMSYVQLRHDNIVYFLGSSWTDCEEVLIVVEHMEKGSLRSVLADTKIDLTWPQRLQMSNEICSGLHFVRSMKGINLSRNLTAKSVLLDAQLVCKMDIFDYASSLRTEWGPARSYGHGDIASRAPELLKGEEITAAAEVYALGVIFCEISLRSKLFKHVLDERGPTLADIFVATEVVAQRLKPSPAEDAPASYRALTIRCLSYEPSERPQLSEVLDMLSA
ncbi:unnamed protein product [Hyaloperonospora brassicae]|uniref:Protein kinase domain-containing protein n=1 Tax=Hyaloperonospora brassicae TaxID=162125 RepID=A0AAV0U0K9_HYABA|nr:unnamed protein product [Hyaloperonospora brassicae]